MRKLFETSEINGMSLPNRFIRSATWEGMATDDGGVTHKLVDLMAALAKGGVGLIISSHSYVRQDGQAGPGQLGVYKDEQIQGLETMTQAVHDNGGKIVMQLTHAGIHANPTLTGQTPLALSAIKGPTESPCREMSIQDIREIIKAFVAGGRRAKSAGFDGVQIHTAHGYLFSQFLSPVFNHRQDNYGGNIQNRARALLETFQEIRTALGRDYPVLVKMNCQDFVDNGLSLEDSVQAGVMLAEAGIDAIELSGGFPASGKLGAIRPGIKTEEKEAYFQNEARAFKEKIDIPLILVGGMRSYQVAERLLDEGLADYISMSRPLIREPDLIHRWQTGDLKRAACLSDNLCFGPARKGDGIYCVTKKKQEMK